MNSWDGIPELIESISDKNADAPIDALRRLTGVQLGVSQRSLSLSKDEHTLHILATKARWKTWWKEHGAKWNMLRHTEAKPDAEAWSDAASFLGLKITPESPARPVWIPSKWTLVLSFGTGDYSYVLETWILDRNETASLLKITETRASLSDCPTLSVEAYAQLTNADADRFLKSLAYIFEYRPKPAFAKSDGKQGPGYYYPHGTLCIKDSANGFIRNLNGHDFSVAMESPSFWHKMLTPEDDRHLVGISHLFLSSKFSEKSKWREQTSLDKRRRQLLGDILDSHNPTSLSQSSNFLTLLGAHGDIADRAAIVRWRDKAKLASAKTIPWQLRCDEFSTASEANVRPHAKREVENADKALSLLDARLSASK